jgi:hypothetical protein
MSGPSQASTRGRARFRPGILAALLLLLTVGVTLFAATTLAGNAHALTQVTALENINNLKVPIGYSASDTPDSSWTSLGSLTAFAPGGAYVVLAKLSLRSTASSPAGVSCALVTTNEPGDQEDASLAPTKGSTLANLSFQGLTVLKGVPGGYPVGGSASLTCHVTGPGADKQVIATGARILAIPVDNATSNLRTFG